MALTNPGEHSHQLREHFTTINFRSEARAVIEQANAIIEQRIRRRGSFSPCAPVVLSIRIARPNRQQNRPSTS